MVSSISHTFLLSVIFCTNRNKTHLFLSSVHFSLRFQRTEINVIFSTFPGWIWQAAPLLLPKNRRRHPVLQRGQPIVLSEYIRKVDFWDPVSLPQCASRFSGYSVWPSGGRQNHDPAGTVPGKTCTPILCQSPCWENRGCGLCWMLRSYSKESERGVWHGHLFWPPFFWPSKPEGEKSGRYCQQNENAIQSLVEKVCVCIDSEPFSWLAAKCLMTRASTQDQTRGHSWTNVLKFPGALKWGGARTEQITKPLGETVPGHYTNLHNDLLTFILWGIYPNCTYVYTG